MLSMHDHLTDIRTSVGPVLKFAGAVKDVDGEHAFVVAEEFARMAFRARSELVKAEPKGSSPAERAFHDAEAMLTAIGCAAMLAHGGTLGRDGDEYPEPWWVGPGEAMADFERLVALAEKFLDNLDQEVEGG